MKKYRQILTFVVICGMIMVMMTQTVTAYAAGTSARSAIVIDSATGEILYEQNAYEKLPMASTTKIMTALIALESGSLDEEFAVDSEAIKVEGSSMGLCEGDIVSMRDLVCGMLLPSGNDAANAAAVRISGSIDEFVGLMNERAAEMGLENTHFVTPSGLDDDTDEHYSTAYDMAVLTSYALQNEDFAAICSQKYISLDFGDPPYDRTLANSNKLLSMCDGVIGVKTGFTDKARRCLVSACERDGATLICVTLNDPDDWQDHINLYDYAFGEMQSYSLGNESFEIAVAGGTVNSLSASSETAEMTLPRGAQSHIKTKICVRPFAFAPVKSGDELGYVSYYYDDRLICKVSVTADEDADAVSCEPDLYGRIRSRIEEFFR